MTTPSADEKALKIKSLLNSYYATENADQVADLRAYSTPSRASTTSQGPSPPRSTRSTSENDFTSSLAALDTQQFDPDAHLRRLIKETRLGPLVDQHRSLTTEVNNLDSEMQTLVYENYNKFITATDIVKSMDGAMTGLDEQLRLLESLIKNAVDRSDAVNGVLEERQATILELTKARALLRKLQAFLEVPRKLKAAVDREAYDVVADIYAQVAPVVERHGHRKALQNVARDIEKYRKEAAEKLRRQLHSGKTSDSRATSSADIIVLISKLGEPTGSLQDDFFGSQRRRLAETLNEKGLETCQVDQLQQTIIDIDDHFLPQLAKTASLSQQLFDASSRPRLIAEVREWFLRYIAAIRGALERAAGVDVANAVTLHPNGNPLEHTKDDVFSDEWGTERLVSILATVCSDLAQIEACLPELNARDKASELIGNALRQHTALSFAALEARIHVELTRYQMNLVDTTDPRKQAQEGLRSLEATLQLGMQRCFAGVSQWGSDAGILQGWREIFGTVVQAQIIQWLQSISQRCLILAGAVEQSKVLLQPPPTALFLDAWKLKAAANSEPSSSIFVLAMSTLCSYIPHRLTPETAKLLEIELGGRWELESHGTPNTASTAAHTLLTAYITAVSNTISQIVLRDVKETPWMSHPAPTAPGAGCRALIEGLQSIDADIAAMEEHTDTTYESIASKALGVAQHSRQSAVSMDALVSAGPIPLAWSSKTSVAATVAANLLHAQAHALKEQALSRNAFQQVQLDCHYLRQQLERMLEGAMPERSAALAAVEELLLVGAERCGEPVLLEPAVLDRMVAGA